MRMCAFVVATAAGVLATVGTAQAGGFWVEQNDAGELASTAQITSGVGELKDIDGKLDGAKDVDIYCINVPNPAMFDAITSAGYDTQLFLFTLSGVALAMGDQYNGGNQGRVTGLFLPGPGDYLIAISRYNNDPVNSLNQLIWANTPRNTQRAPDGPGAPGPLAGWNDNATGSSGGYKILLKGAEYSVPAPGAAGLMVLGAVALGRRRR